MEFDAAMTKKFTVNVGGQNMDVWGPDEGTQEQAQEQATRLMAQKQAADVQRDFSGPGRVLANVAQGGAELVGGPAQLMGATPGPLYQQTEAAPTTTGDKIARFAGAALPLAPLGAAGVGVSRGVGAVEGASAPADSPTQRAINTGLGGIIGGGAPSSLGRLAGMTTGMLHGGLGGLESLFSGYLGGQIGSQAHHTVANFLRQYPPSVVARALAQLGDPFTRMLAKQYDAMPSDRPPTPPQQ